MKRFSNKYCFLIVFLFCLSTIAKADNKDKLYNKARYAYVADKQKAVTGKKSGSDVFGQRSNRVQVTAGVVDVVIGSEGSVVSLNSISIFKSGSDCKIYQLLRLGAVDCLVIKEGELWRYLKIDKKGGCSVSQQYQERLKHISHDSGALKTKDKYVKFGETVEVEADRSGFWSFYSRFKSEERFQRSRISFPVSRSFVNERDEKISSDFMSEKEWVYMDFTSDEMFRWNPPLVKSDTASVHMEGLGSDIKIRFRKQRNKWKLVAVSIVSQDQNAE